MAGEIVIRQTLTQRLVDEIYNWGSSCNIDFTFNILVDCSHNAGVWTRRPDTGEVIISKGIELDCSLQANTEQEKLAEAVKKALLERSQSQLLQFYKALSGIGVAGGTPKGLSALMSRAIKIEFPNFDGSIVNLNAAKLALAVQACRPTTVAEVAKRCELFNQLPKHVRRSMGMYERRSLHDYALLGEEEPQPREARLQDQPLQH